MIQYEIPPVTPRLLPTKCSSVVAFAITALSLSAAPEPALAQGVTCVPFGSGVPPNLRPPNWWLSTAPQYTTRLDDPRWQGAVGHSDGSTMAEHVEFQAIHRTGPPDSLYLSWFVKVDNEIQPGLLGDAVWFGIQQGTNNPVLVKLTLTGPAVVGEAQGQVNYGVDVFQGSGTGSAITLTPIRSSTGGIDETTGDPLPAPPAWMLETTALWISSLGLGGTSASWAFQTVVPISGGGLDVGIDLDVANNFSMWYQIHLVLDGLPNPVPYSWPRGAPPVDPEGLGNFSGPTTWEEFSIGTTTAGACIGDVTIAQHSDIGTTNDPQSRIEFSLPPSPLPANLETLAPQNTFFVRPTNNTAGTISNGEITAEYWIANWGSQPDWNDIPNPADLWKQIPPPITPPSSALPQGLAPLANRIEQAWTMNVCEWFNFLDPSIPEYSDAALQAWVTANSYPIDCVPFRYEAKTHQCLLVELSSTSPHTFLRKIFWNNLDVVEASHFSRDVRISVEGLLPTGNSDPKTLYLFLETINLQTIVPGNRRYAVLPETRNVVDAAARDTLNQPSRFGKSPLDSLLPTYRVHAYRETAQTIQVDGVTLPVLRPQSSFGYWVTHDGEIAGWQHRIEGVGLVELAPNFYRLSVPTDSFATVTTTIQAIEPKPFALSLHAGVSTPHGTFNSSFDPGFGITADLAYRISHYVSVEALLGIHRFGGTGSTGNLDVLHGSGSVKIYPTSGRARLFVNAGSGIYKFDPGSRNAGVLVGGGVQYNLSVSAALEASFAVHNVFTTGANTRFSSIQGGGRVRF